MTRREIREAIFQMAFRVEFHTQEELVQQMHLFLDAMGEMSEKDRSYMENKTTDLFAHLGEIDALIDASASGWKTSRMAKVELTLLRLAVYEIKFEEDIPTGVAINEAVELAKAYGDENSASFVNGVLARIV